MDRWYVLFTKPQKEHQVHEQLQRSGITSFLPLLPRRDREQRKRKKPLFPRYLFVRLNLETTSMDTIRWTPGLVAPVMFGGEYAFVDDSVISYIQKRLTELEQGAKSPFRRGDRVRIKGNHPLAALEAVFERPLSDAKRAWVLIEVLGRLTRCQVDIALLEPVDQAPIKL